MKIDHYKTNTAKLPTEGTSNARNWSGEKEEIASMQVIGFSARDRRNHITEYGDELEDHGRGAGFREVVTARFWMARSGDGASPIYCSVWVHTRDGRCFSGRGTACGGGYHKTSAALAYAIVSAGIKLGSPHFGGCGEGAMRHALIAIARAAGYSRLPLTIV